MNGKGSPLLWAGVGVAAAGFLTRKTALIGVGIALAVAGAVGKQRILDELPPGIKRQISEAVEEADSKVTGNLAPSVTASAGQEGIILW